mgnify:CR=1 FL=1
MNSPTSLVVMGNLPALLTTNEFALGQRCMPQTVRKNYSLNGHHHGVKPIKQASGRLLWKLSDLEALLSGGK